MLKCSKETRMAAKKAAVEEKSVKHSTNLEKEEEQQNGCLPRGREETERTGRYDNRIHTTVIVPYGGKWRWRH